MIHRNVCFCDSIKFFHTLRDIFLHSRCEKLKNELTLKSEIWTEKEAFYKVKQEDAEKTISQLQEKLAKGPATGI